MLDIKNITIEINDKVIVKQLKFSVQSGDIIAIIGEEGNGKSTLLKAIYDASLIPYAHITGTIHTHGHRLAYLPQSFEEVTGSVAQYIYCADSYDQPKRLYQLLSQYGLDQAILDRSFQTLSGGEKVKVALLKLELQEPDMMLLDEPSNDLDLESLAWLEKWITSSIRPILFVSHDEHLLENTANAIIHLELRKKKQEAVTTYQKISYQAYVAYRDCELKRDTKLANKERNNLRKKEAKLSQVKAKVEHQQETITRKNPHGAKMLKRKMKTLKVQEKRFNDQDLREVPDVEEKITLFFPPTSIPPTKPIIALHLDELSIGTRVLARKINLEVIGPKHIVITGKNGIGKSTLLKYIKQECEKNKSLSIGYLPQNYMEVLPEMKTPVTFLEEIPHPKPISKIRSDLGNLNFTKEEMVAPIQSLSSGSKAKLLLCYLTYQPVTVLLLDEPTRNISPLSQPVIYQMLKDFKGAIISVSHDRSYIDTVCDTIYQLENNGLYKRYTYEEKDTI